MQQTVAEDITNSFRVQAPAGTGKTKVLTERLKNICKNTSPEKILTITFTNKACQELVQRIEESLPQYAHLLSVKTFHSYCYTILQEFHTYTALQFPVQIADNEDIREVANEFLVNNLIKSTYIDVYLVQFISKVQGERINQPNEDPYKVAADVVADYQKGVHYLKDAFALDYIVKNGLRVYRYYLAYMQSCNLIDFNDIIRETLRIIKIPKVYQTLYNRYSYVQIDEMQDTSTHELSIIETILTCDHEVTDDKYLNCALFGDLNQCIYTWRDAKPIENCDRFGALYPNAKLYGLDVNYRSTKVLLDFAQSYLNMYDLALTDTNCESVSTGVPVKVKSFKTIEEEVADIVRQIKNNEITGRSAILVRTNALAKKVYELTANDIPTVCVDQLKLFEKTSIRDLLSAFSFAINTNNLKALKRILKSPLVNMSVEKLNLIESDCAKIKISLADILISKDYAALFRAYEANKILTFDVETTGLSSQQDEIIQIAAIIGGKDGVQKTLDLKIKPTRSVGASQYVHGFTDEYLTEHGISSELAVQQFDEFIKSNQISVFCGHNVGFDIGMCNALFSKYGKTFAPATRLTFDTCAMAQMCVSGVPNHKLSTMADYFKISATPNHNAYYDILATFQVLECMLKVLAVQGEEELLLSMNNIMLRCQHESQQVLSIMKYLRTHTIAESTIFMVNDKGLKMSYQNELQYLRLFYKLAQTIHIDELSHKENILNLLEFSALHANQLQESLLFKDSIPIVTVHNSKGLEYDNVFVVGCDHKTFPNQRAVKIKPQLDEEKRLMYVAITRAKHLLQLSYSGYPGVILDKIKDQLEYLSN